MNLDAQVSAHFKAREFACHCGGRNAGCHIVILNGQLIRALEGLRARFYPMGLTIVDAYRCPQENARAEQASGQRVLPNSQHVVGTAADVPGRASLASVAGLKLFTGIGYQRDTGLVTHVDVRPGASVLRPVTWSYPLA